MTTQEQAVTESTHIKITIEDIYREQQEMKQILARMSEKLDAFGNIPARVSQLEIEQARNAWVPKFMWAALLSGVGGFVTAIWQLLNK
jgi:hypothetical protein